LPAVALSVAACAGDAADLCEVRSPLRGGAIAADQSGVFALSASSHGGTDAPTMNCSASLIAPNLLLTARHCVARASERRVLVCGASPLGDPVDPRGLRASNDARPTIDSTWLAISDVFVPTEGRDVCGFDIAVAILESSVDGLAGMPPSLARFAEVGDEFTVLGFGDMNETGGAAPARRMTKPRRVVCTGFDCGIEVSDHEFSIDAELCDGDSGGPAVDADGAIVGVVSRSAIGCTSPIFTSVAAFGPFLRDAAVRAAELGSYAPSDWAPGERGMSTEPPAHNRCR
jgi:hypothetical protein